MKKTPARSKIVARTDGQVLEARLVLLEEQLDRAGRAIALLADDDFGHVRLLALFFLVVVAVDEHDDVGILLDGAGLAQVGHQRAFVGALLDRAIELRERHHRALQFLGQHFQAARDLAPFGGPGCPGLIRRSRSSTANSPPRSGRAYYRTGAPDAGHWRAVRWASGSGFRRCAVSPCAAFQWLRSGVATPHR